MPTDRPPPRHATRRPATVPAKIPTGPPIKKYLPYALAAAAIGALALLVRSPRYMHYGVFGMGLVVMAALAYVAMSYRISLAPEDRLRVVLPALSVATLVAAAIPFGYTVFPPAPRGTVSLAAQGEARGVDVSGTNSTLWLTVRGRFVPTATGTANYFLTVARAGGGASERVDGTLRPQPGAEPVERHVLGLRGPGRFDVRLETSSAAIALPLSVSVHAKPVSTMILVIVYAALALLAVLVDVVLWRRGMDPSFAAAMMFPLAAVTYFQLKPATESLPTELLAAAIIGAVAGGIGGELLSRLGRLIVGKGDD